MIKTSKTQDLVIFIVILGLTLTSFYASYGLKLPGSVVAIVWIVWLILSMSIAYLSTPGQSAFEFSKQAKAELLKVVWPSRKETVQTTIIVVVMVSIAGFLLWLADTGMMWSIGKITHLG